MKKCVLCNGTSGVKKCVHHHLTYNPEQIIILCIKCHSTVHHLARLSIETRQYIEQIILKYSYDWSCGNEKYKKSERYKECRRGWNQKIGNEKKRLSRRMNGIPARNWRKDGDKEKYAHEYYIKNKEKILNRVKDYREQNKEKIKHKNHMRYLKKKSGL